MAETGGPATALASDNIVAILLEQHDEWLLQHRYMTLETMTGLMDEPAVSLPMPAAKAA